MSVTREVLLNHLDQTLTPAKFRDYCPNGLQVEGCPDIQRVVTGVTASQALIDAAVERQADAIVVHHGYFWKSEDPRIVGMKGRRIRTLIEADINLFAYHLPLDCHLELGNNAGLGRAMWVEDFGPMYSEDPTFPVFQGELEQVVSVGALGQRLEQALHRPVTVVGDRAVKRVAWCTGGGQGYIDAAADAGFDCFVTGEISEQTVHVARERGIGFIAAGHHATERFGVSSLAEFLRESMGLNAEFVDIDSPA